MAEQPLSELLITENSIPSVINPSEIVVSISVEEYSALKVFELKAQEQQHSSMLFTLANVVATDYRGDGEQLTPMSIGLSQSSFASFGSDGSLQATIDRNIFNTASEHATNQTTGSAMSSLSGSRSGTSTPGETTPLGSAKYFSRVRSHTS